MLHLKLRCQFFNYLVHIVSSELYWFLFQLLHYFFFCLWFRAGD